MKNVFKGFLLVMFLLLSAAFVNAAVPELPVLNAISDKTVNEGALLSVQVLSGPPDSPSPDAPIAFSISVCQSSGAGEICIPFSDTNIIGGRTTMTITSLSQLAASISWTPDFSQSGIYKVYVLANDDDSISIRTFKVTVVDVPPQIAVVSPIVFGGDNQDRSDPNHDTENLREVNVSSTISIQNVGPEQLTKLEVSSITFASGFSASDLNINYTWPKTTLAPGESISLPITVRFPQKLDAVDNSQVRISPLVATINFAATPAVSGGTVTGKSLIQEKAENDLRFKTVKVLHGDKSETVKDGDKVDNLKAGESVSFEIEVENKFSDKQDVKLEDVTVKVLSDSDLDIDEDESINDLSANDKDTVKLDSVIDDTADDGTFDVVISVDGTDEFGAKHGEKMTVRFEVKRKSHEISIESMSFNPPSVTCESSTRLTTHIKNTGRRDEDDTYVRVSVPELSFGAISDRVSLDKDDETTVGFNIPVPANTKPGSYRVSVDTYYDTGTSSSTDAQLLNVGQCKPASTEQPPAITPPVVAQPPVVVVEQPPKANNTSATAPAPVATQKSFLETPQYIALLVLAYVVVLGGGAALLLRLARR